MVNEGFKVEDVSGNKEGMSFDRKVTFYQEATGKIEAEYYYSNGKVNWLLSWGFSKDSLGELRKSKAHKAKKPFFSFQQGWFGENSGK